MLQRKDNLYTQNSGNNNYIINFLFRIGSGGFSTDGVVTASINIEDGVTTIQCLSYHTTSFAVLVDVAGSLQVSKV